MIDHTTATTTLTLRGSEEGSATGQPGVDPRSVYVDYFWLPLLGPVALCTARLLTELVASGADPIHLSVDEIGSSIGIEDGTAPATVLRALQRLESAGIITVAADGSLHLLPQLPRLSAGQVERLPDDLQLVHRDWAPEVSADQPAIAPLARTNSNRLLTLAATIENTLVNPLSSPQQNVERWQQVLRQVEEIRDEAIIDWAAPDLEMTLAELHMASQSLTEAVWSAQHVIATQGELPADTRAELGEAAARIIDWMVTEFPST